MELEKQVCSLELSRKLDELLDGKKPESLFWWDDHTEIGMGYIVSFDEADNPVCPAYTVAELGYLLPDYIEVEDTQCHLECYPQDDTPHVVVYATNAEAFIKLIENV